jgi:uncharacterized protein (DUF1778 family)
MSTEKKKKQNPYTKRNRINFRVDNEELREILTKAQLYHGGDVSEFVRDAALKYKPTKKVAR